MKSYKLIFITWIDAQSGAEWEEPDKVIKWNKDLYEVFEIGWEICSDKDYVTICSQIGNDGSLGNKTKIPIRWIKSKKVLNEKPLQKQGGTRLIQDARKRFKNVRNNDK